MRLSRSCLLALMVLSALFAGCGDDDSGPMGDAGNFDGGPDEPPVMHIPNPTLVQTMAPETVVAGNRIDVTCVVLDDRGEIYSATGRTPRIRVSPETSVRREDGDIIAIQSGVVEVTCAFSDLMLTDESPALVQIVPGSPAEVVTNVDRTSAEAGETISVTCETFDAYGNRVPEADETATMSVSPTDDGNTTDGRTTTFTASGRYEVSCDVTGATSTAERVEITPTVPAAIVLGKVPDLPVYAIGQVVEVVSVVTDRYDNEVTDAPIDFVSAPDADATLGPNRFRYFSDGTYVVTATVQPPTEGDADVSAQVTIVVDGNGPSIQCSAPTDGGMIDAVPGSSLTFGGSVADTSGIESVQVNGAPATLADDGTFTAPLTVDFGINFVDIVARDEFGAESSHTCSFLASNRWADPASTFDDTVALSMGMRAIDDGDPSGPIDSLNDLLHLVVNSDGLHDQLHTSLLAANPLKDSCDQTIFGGCVHRSRVDYLMSRLGDRYTNLTLIDGGMHAFVRLDNVDVQVEIDSTTYDGTGWMFAEYVEIDLDLDVSVVAGRPRISVRPGSVVVVVGPMDSDFGTIGDFIFSILEGRIRGILEDTLRDYVSTSFDTVLDGVAGGLDISSLGATFSVPRIDGSGTLDVNFGVDFASASVTPGRFLLGIGTRFSGPVTIARPTLGVAVPPGTMGSVIRDDPDLRSRSMGVSIHTALFNQVFHALWRGGLLQGTITGESLGGSFPEGLSATLDGALPPVAEMNEEGEVDIGIGTLNLTLVYPGLFDEPLPVTLGARASADVALDGGDLAFSGIVIDELFFSTREVSLDADTREVLERFLISLVQSLVDGVLNDSLPALPIPSFELPDSLMEYDIPPGTELGLQSPLLENEPQHFVLRGDFGSL